MNENQEGFANRDITGRILKEFFSVYNELGHGFLESVYEKALAIAMRQAGLKVETQKEVQVWFRGHCVGKFRADLVVEDCVIVELKAARSLDPAHQAQVLNYLRASRFELGLLLNFGDKPDFKRLVYSDTRKTIPRIDPPSPDNQP